MIKRLKITVTGRVQGVYFRGSTQQTARGYSLKGFVKNQEDGTVYIEAEGPEDSLKKFISWCSRGPEHAIVEKIDIEEDTPVGYTGFSVRY